MTLREAPSRVPLACHAAQGRYSLIAGRQTTPRVPSARGVRRPATSPTPHAVRREGEGTRGHRIPGVLAARGQSARAAGQAAGLDLSIASECVLLPAMRAASSAG